MHRKNKDKPDASLNDPDCTPDRGTQFETVDVHNQFKHLEGREQDMVHTDIDQQCLLVHAGMREL